MDPLTTQSSSQPTTNMSKFETVVRMLRKYWLILVIFVILLLLALIYTFTVKQFNTHITADHAEHGRTSPSVHEIVHVKQMLTVGVGSSNPPMSQEINGNLSGFEIDLAKAIGVELNVPVKFVQSDFRQAIAHGKSIDDNPLSRNEVDIVIDSLIESRDSQQLYAFSKSYLSHGQVAVSLASNTAINSLESLSAASVGVVENSNGFALMSEFLGPEQVKTYSAANQAVNDITSGTIQAIVVDAPHAQALVADNPSLHIATELLTQEEYVIAMRRDESDLSLEIDRILEKLRQRGVIESLRHKWLE